MSIDWNHFTPLAALAGGVLIGIAAAMFALLNGRIAGISGVLGGLLRPAKGDMAWRIAFVLGLVGAPPCRPSCAPVSRSSCSRPCTSSRARKEGRPFMRRCSGPWPAAQQGKKGGVGRHPTTLQPAATGRGLRTRAHVG